ncbi:hypothetical protein RRG08_047425 [Elysia crispata]|uniref:Uncharacterized protein n=1 Tax=Elysia crispata TaxID=231223 RepID=A0AAE0YTW4_9GAST|nr:hypothetical protein RRG08_047425 [Elysia crispata]
MNFVHITDLPELAPLRIDHVQAGAASRMEGSRQLARRNTQQFQLPGSGARPIFVSQSCSPSLSLPSLALLVFPLELFPDPRVGSNGCRLLILDDLPVSPLEMSLRITSTGVRYRNPDLIPA